MDDDFDIEPIHCSKCKVVTTHEVYRFKTKDEGIETITICDECKNEIRKITTKEQLEAESKITFPVLKNHEIPF